MKRLVPLITILTFTSTLFLSACGQVNQQPNEDIPAFRVGLNEEHDQSGLAKRVVKAFAEDSELAEISSIYVAQNGSTVILKGTVPNQTVLDKMVTVAQSVQGTTSVETSQVKVKTP